MPERELIFCHIRADRALDPLAPRFYHDGLTNRRMTLPALITGPIRRP
jgi:hypothetical protein